MPLEVELEQCWNIDPHIFHHHPLNVRLPSEQAGSLSSISLELMSLMELPISLTLRFNTCQESVPLKCTFLLELALKFNTSQSLLIPPSLYFYAVWWPCVTLTNSESVGKIQYKMRTTTKKVNFRYFYFHTDTLWKCRTQMFVFLLLCSNSFS